jgi:hypothetical protein
MVVGLDEGDREVRMSISISLASEEGATCCRRGQIAGH